MSRKLFLILDNVRSAFNVGSIFRLADAVKAEVILCGICPTPGAKPGKADVARVDKVSKTALGAEANVKWRYFDSVTKALEHVKKRIPGISIYSVEVSPEAKDIYKTDFPKSLALVFGHEITGVSNNAKKLSDKIVKIPMRGKKRSLNVAMAAGIVSYEVIRQWKKRQKAVKRKK